ncbi:MAG: type II toxin-antitoxin system RelE/ParE family toxin [Candidatus Thiodiazotropha lotti]|nr:type II toxin-antitoxin system RelE/ParE family toxin [Candidatus Thiodiazotropha lotti]
MRIFKNKAFSKWATKEGLGDDVLQTAVEEMEHGLIDADLGGHVVKKRAALVGRGKSGGARTLIVYKTGNKAFFVYGFAKNARANIKVSELQGLKAYAAILLNYSEKDLDKAVKAGALIEVESNE